MEKINQKKLTIGFIGQGWIGKNYADNFEERGYKIVRYALEAPYNNNGDKIKNCDIVFIAVPTPTTPKGFDDSILRKAIKKVGKNKTAVIKSTLLPGYTESIQEENPDIFVMHSPEFLREATAAYDAAHPERNIIGIPKNNQEYNNRAQAVMSVLPKASYKLICEAREAELIKYVGNAFLHQKVVFFNMIYDLAKSINIDYEKIRNSVAADPRIGDSHMAISHSGGRGSGGHCFIKDFAAFIEMYDKFVGDDSGLHVLKGIEKKNIAFLISSNKDLDLLKMVYGEDILDI